MGGMMRIIRRLDPPNPPKGGLYPPTLPLRGTGSKGGFTPQPPQWGG